MQDYLSLPFKKREEIIAKIQKTLRKKEDIIFAYVFGSFLDSPSFKDIDIGIYLQNIEKDKVFEREMKIAEELAKDIYLSADIIEIKILNFAPLSFQNNIFRKGRLLFSKDKELLSDLIEESSLEMVTNSHITYQSLKELVPT